MVLDLLDGVGQLCPCILDGSIWSKLRYDQSVGGTSHLSGRAIVPSLAVAIDEHQQERWWRPRNRARTIFGFPRLAAPIDIDMMSYYPLDSIHALTWALLWEEND